MSATILERSRMAKLQQAVFWTAGRNLGDGENPRSRVTAAPAAAPAAAERTVGLCSTSRMFLNAFVLLRRGDKLCSISRAQQVGCWTLVEPCSDYAYSKLRVTG